MSARRTSSGHMTSSIPRARTTSKGRTAPRSGANGRRSSTPSRSGGGRNAAAKPTTRRGGDFTLPIAREKQVASNRGVRLIVWGGGTAIMAALLVTFFIFPVRAYLRQEGDLEARRRELALLDEQNAELQADVAALGTPAGVEQAAREELGYVRAGEIRLSVLPAPAAPLTLPGGWPYDALAQVINVRSAAAAQP